MTWPTSYDVESDTFLLGAELAILTLTTGVDSSTTSFTFNEHSEVDALNVPSYLTCLDETTAGGFEIIKITAKGGSGTGQLTATRHVLGSTTMAHPSSSRWVQDPVSIHLETIRALLLGVEKYHGKAGLASALPGTCVAGEVYIATDTHKVHQAIDTNVWREINELNHSTLTGMADDDHTDLHTVTRKAAWHAAQTGVHITKAAHIHDNTSDDGQPIKRFEHGLLSAMPGSPSATGQTYFATDTQDLYFGNSGSWVRYSVMPTETIILFEGACPTGWTRISNFDEKFPRGAPTGVYSGFTDGGFITHTHTMPDIVNHSHQIPSQGATSDDGGSHGHGKPHHSFAAGGGSSSSGGVGANDYPFDISHSSHSHSTTFAAHNTSGSGSNPATSETAPSLPLWINLVFCEKD